MLEVDDYRWLVGPEAARRLDRVAADTRPLVALTAHLRRELSATRVHLLLEQVDLRRRAKAKFAHAERMFFTRAGLEQATDGWVAEYKAARFAQQAPVADLCCGIGGDLLGLARRGPVTGVDRDPVAALLAEANLAVLTAGDSSAGNAIRVADAGDFSVAGFAAWHIDPDRRSEGVRTSQPAWSEPDPSVIEARRCEQPDAAVKLSPAAEVPEAWTPEAEREWITRDRQCRQQIAWLGSLARHPGAHRATLVRAGSSGAEVVACFVGQPGSWLPPASNIRRYVFDPDPSILAADLTGAIAAHCDLAPVAPGIAYLTGDQPASEPLLAGFEVTEVLPLDEKRLRHLLHQRNIGRLEIKKRGVATDPGALRRHLHLRGDESAVLLLVPIAGHTAAILARRVAGRPETV